MGVKKMNHQPKRNTLEQGRAEFAYQRAKTASEKTAIREDYKSYVKKIPMLIKTNGLGATIAFVKAKEGDAYDIIYQDISAWLVAQGLLKKDEKFLEVIIQKDSSESRRITIEVLAFLNWLKRFADGLIQVQKPKKTEKTDGNGKG
jgi:CRISPR-associated protein Cmr5